MNERVRADVDRALTALAAGEMIVVVDDASRENEGDIVVAADRVTESQMAFIVRNTTGIVCVPMSGDRAAALGLHQMVSANTERHATAFTVPVDHLETSTGVSASDRTRTVRALVDPSTAPADLRRPGHVFPLRARDGGVLERPGHTEATVDLLRMAGLPPVGVISEIVADDGSMRRGADLLAFAARHDLPVLAIEDLVVHRRTSGLVEQIASAALPVEHADFRAVAYRSVADGIEHLALVLGDVEAASASERGVLVRVHSECLTGDVLGSMRCDCGSQLGQALRDVAAEGCGVVVYLRGQEGRGIGLAHKIRAYALQDAGLDTVEANEALGLAVDARTYDVGAQILLDLGCRRIRLITNSPDKYGGLAGLGLDIVDRISLAPMCNVHNIDYLRTKRDRMGHLFDLAGGPSRPAADLHRASGSG